MIRQNGPSFCQDFSTNFGSPKKFDGKFRGENWQIEGRELAFFSPQFAVKHHAICKPLIFNILQNLRKIGDFVKISYQNSPMSLSITCTKKRDWRLLQASPVF